MLWVLVTVKVLTAAGPAGTASVKRRATATCPERDRRHVMAILLYGMKTLKWSRPVGTRGEERQSCHLSFPHRSAIVTQMGFRSQASEIAVRLDNFYQRRFKSLPVHSNDHVLTVCRHVQHDHHDQGRR